VVGLGNVSDTGKKNNPQESPFPVSKHHHERGLTRESLA
jgi:hypothetical protein